LNQQNPKSGGIGKKIFIFLFILILAGGWAVFNITRLPEPEQTPEPSPLPSFNKKILKIGIGSRLSGMLFYAVNHYIPDNKFILEPVVIPDPEKRWSLLAAGELDLNFSTLSEFVLAAPRNNPGKLICFTSSSSGNDGILVRGDIKNLNSLAGKKICIVPGSSEHFFLVKLLNSMARSTAEVKIIPASRMSDTYAYFTGDEFLDAAVLTEPYLSRGKKAGYVQLVSSGTSHTITEIIVAGNFALEHRPEDVQVVVDAYFNLVNFIRNNPGLAKKLISSRSGVSIEDVDLMFTSVKLKDLEEARTPRKESIVDAMEKIQQVWIIEGLPNADRPVNFKNIVELVFMEKSLVPPSSPLFSDPSPHVTEPAEEWFPMGTPTPESTPDVTPPVID
jgi:ABC-type nitrate/sulfonate/bicarbonate transport system substrate-binding protein